MANLDIIRGRQVVVPLMNRTGADVIAGDVVVMDTANDESFITTTTVALAGVIGVVQETIVSLGTGRVLIAGYAPLVKVGAAVTRGQYAETSAVAKQAGSSATRHAGSFAQWLKSTATPSALLWGLTDPGGGAVAAPTGAQYLVGALDGTLSAERVRADLYKSYHPDNYPISGTGSVVDEFDAGALSGSWTWDTAPGGTVSLSRFPGFLHIDGGTDSAGTIRHLRQAYAPGAATAFSIATKVKVAFGDGNFIGIIGMATLSSADALIGHIRIQNGSDATSADSYRLIFGTGGGSTWKEVVVPIAFAPQYLLMTRSAADVYEYYASADGMVWQYVGTNTLSTAVAKVSLMYGADTDAPHIEASCDFIRTFTSVTRVIGA